MSVDESNFDYTYAPEHLKERVADWRSLCSPQRMELICELSLAAWEKLGVACEATKPMDKTIRRVNRTQD